MCFQEEVYIMKSTPMTVLGLSGVGDRNGLSWASHPVGNTIQQKKRGLTLTDLECRIADHCQRCRAPASK